MIILRHAQRGMDGSYDPPIVESAYKNIDELASILQKEHIRMIVTSPYLRARQTAESLALHLGVPVVVDVDASEVVLKKLQGTDLKLKDITLHYRPSVVEKPYEFQERVKRLLAKYHKCNVLIITHGTVLSCIQRLLFLKEKKINFLCGYKFCESILYYNKIEYRYGLRNED